MAMDPDGSGAVRELAQVTAAAEAAERRLHEANRALLDANQRLAHVPLLEHKIAELLEENVWLVRERDRLSAEIEELRRGSEQPQGAAGAADQ